ncbi:MAG: hypothetical protein ACLGG0_13165 [Bacteriovoracia bacterium]
MNYLAAFLILLLGNSYAQESRIDTSRIGQDKSKEQVITLTKEKLALELENKKLQNSIDDLKKTLAEVTKEKLDLEKELSALEKELASAEVKLDTAEQKKQRLQAIVDQVSRAIQNP